MPKKLRAWRPRRRPLLRARFEAEQKTAAEETARLSLEAEKKVAAEGHERFEAEKAAAEGELVHVLSVGE